jgi:quinolinate synthase
MKSKATDIKATRAAIRRLVKQKKAIILAHNYQPPEIQDVADLCGDSLELSIRAAATEARIIVFCGVHFMAETASILSPDKKVLLPAPGAGCPMANMITAADLKQKRREIPGACVISYVNTTAAVKAESDICCTSANAVPIADSVDPAVRIFMTPDRNLAQYTRKQTEREIDFWNGYCPVHNNLTVQQVEQTRAKYPGAVFLAHPECPPDVLDLADEIKSTSGMIAYAADSNQKEFIIGTEVGILYPLSKKSPDKVFIPADPNMVCPDMKKIGLPDIIRSLENLTPEVNVPDEIRQKAKKAVDRMLEIH